MHCVSKKKKQHKKTKGAQYVLKMISSLFSTKRGKSLALALLSPGKFLVWSLLCSPLNKVLTSVLLCPGVWRQPQSWFSELPSDFISHGQVKFWQITLMYLLVHLIPKAILHNNVAICNWVIEDLSDASLIVNRAVQLLRFINFF